MGTSGQASECIDNAWQPTFVHDNDIPDGPWYVLPNGVSFTKLQGLTEQVWIPQACQLIQQYGVRDRRGFTNCNQYTRIQCGCRRGMSEGNRSCAAFLAARRPAAPAQAQMRFNNPALTQGYWIDRCLGWATQCDAPAANAFCQRVGYDRATDFKWSYHAPTMVISTGQICNDASACGGFDYVTCQRGAGGAIAPTGQSGGQGGDPCSNPGECRSGLCLLGVCSQ